MDFRNNGSGGGVSEVVIMKGGGIMGVGGGVLFVMLFMLYNLIKLLSESKE